VNCWRGLVLALVSLVASAASAEPAEREWLMVVKSHNTDPARRAEFTHWYDRIDVPDVLQVPGYDRARRGMAVDPLAAAVGQDGPYVALYTIRSADIDKTIIAMLMASWRMDQLGRGTDLIKVTERLYYRRAGKGWHAPAAQAATHLFLYRPNSAGKSASPIAIRAIVESGLAISATPYTLYQVLMHEPVVVPPELILLELAASSEQDARAAASSIVGRLGGSLDCADDCAAYTLLLDVSG
jgi:hypothetical protein